MSAPRLVLASANAHKVREVGQILAELCPGFHADELASSADYQVADPVEDAPTFAGNALIKARALAAASNLPTIADDSGLCVDILGGAPGIFSARWCGRHGDDEANLRLLLDQLRDVRDEHRGAHFTCAAALVLPNGEERVEEGILAGRLLREPAGAGGFGYDPIFVPDTHDVSTAELSAQEKNRISHRRRALAALAPAISAAL